MHNICDNKETTRIMKSFQTALALLLGIFFVFNTFVSNASDGDSTSSSIAFNGLEATLSSRIIHFKWDVSSEENGAFILVEKSLNEEDWTEVAKVASLKSHKEQHTYEISEINFAEGVNEYFRIVRVDEFGKKTELDRININRPVLSNILLIPSPKKINKETVISYDSMIASRGSITIYSQDSAILLDKMIDISEGYNRYTINIKDFAAGNYSVVILDEYDNKIAKRLVVHNGRR